MHSRTVNLSGDVHSEEDGLPHPAGMELQEPLLHPGWNFDWLDLAYILYRQLQLLWIHEYHGSIVSGRHCFVTVLLWSCLSFVRRVCVWYSTLINGWWLHRHISYTLWPAVSLCVICHLLSKDASLMRTKTYTKLWGETQVFDDDLVLWPFGQIIVLGSPIELMSSQLWLSVE